MNSSQLHHQNWNSEIFESDSTYLDVHQHLDDNSHLYDEMLRTSQLATSNTSSVSKGLPSGILFHFFEGLPMSHG